MLDSCLPPAFTPLSPPFSQNRQQTHTFDTLLLFYLWLSAFAYVRAFLMGTREKMEGKQKPKRMHTTKTILIAKLQKQVATRPSFILCVSYIHPSFFCSLSHSVPPLLSHSPTHTSCLPPAPALFFFLLRSALFIYDNSWRQAKQVSFLVV